MKIELPEDLRFTHLNAYGEGALLSIWQIASRKEAARHAAQWNSEFPEDAPHTLIYLQYTKWTDVHTSEQYILSGMSRGSDPTFMASLAPEPFRGEFIYSGGDVLDWIHTHPDKRPANEKLADWCALRVIFLSEEVRAILEAA